MENNIAEYLEPAKTVYLSEDAKITDGLVKDLIKIKEKDLDRYKALQNYYQGKAKITDRQKDSRKANNKLALGYPSYIIDILLGMFVGKPVSYTVTEENKEVMAGVQDIFDLNDEQDENIRLAGMAGIKGRAYEIVCLNEGGQVCFNEMEPENIMVVYSNQIKPESLFCLYVRDDVGVDNLTSGKRDKVVTLYTKESVKNYALRGGDLSLIDEESHTFGGIPVVEFLGNDEEIGDFERILSPVDVLNLAQSNTTNDFQEFTDALLVFYGMPQTDSDDVNQMMVDRVLLLDKAGNRGQGAHWLIRDINDTALKNYKNGLDADIHKFVRVPDVSGRSFAGNVSEESMKYEPFATDQIINQKQREFKTSLQKRIKLILSVLNIKGSSDLDYRDISIVFNDSKLYNELDNINTVETALDAGLSRTYTCRRLRDINDIQGELDRQSQKMDTYSEAFKEELEDDRQEVPEDSDVF